MKNKNTKQKEIICLQTHRNGDFLLATMRSSPRKKLHIKRAKRCDYLIFSLNKNSDLYIDYIHSVRISQGMTESQFPQENQTTIKQDEGFMICKISGIHKLSKTNHPNIHPEDPFYEITFKEHASIKIPSLYENKKNPVSYFTEDQILKLLNIKDFEELEWSTKNDLEPVFYDPEKYPAEDRAHFEEQNYYVQAYRDDLSAFIEREMDEIIGSNVYLNDDEISKNLFIEQQKKKFKDGKLKVDFPFKIKSKEGSVIKVLKTIEEWAEHNHWMMMKSYEFQKRTQELVEQKIKQGKVGEDAIVTWEEYKEIAKDIGIEIEQWSHTSDYDISGAIKVNTNYQVPAEKNLEEEIDKFLDEPKFMKRSVDKESNKTVEDPALTLYHMDDIKELSIDEAKIGLSRKYDIPIENIEVILKG